MKTNISILSLILRAIPLISVASSTSPPSQIPINSGSKYSQYIYGNSDVVKLHKDLVSIESITGNEYEVGQYLAHYLSSRNFTVETQLVPPLQGASNDQPRLNIFAYMGTTRATRLLITSHMDTVAPYIPYSRSSNGEGNEICGRGTTDAKGCIASQITAVEELFGDESIHEGDIGLLFVVGEERDGAGMKTASDLFQKDGLTWEAVIFGEPSEHKLVLGHKGGLVSEITAYGKAAHSSYPELGINANSMLIRVLTAIDAMKLPGSEKLGDTTTNIGVIQGGVAMNIIPARASATVLTRLAFGTPEEAMIRIRAVVESVEFEEGRVELTFGHRFAPVDCDVDIDGM
jgi:acetylornithine deacetylase